MRCIAAVLLMVGRGQEAPEVVRQLLDVDATPSKPYYNMAPEVGIIYERIMVNQFKHPTKTKTGRND